ncbi:Ribosomal RNA large subunit methyltransferase H [Spiroplasma poulsonii]|uniref:Ribosomal RNA large subunit methyltransferase H n=1 Tax=Spiroplasma poulsonii TaxID=2138 RepID=A0A2P6FB79_9MOLU|nr:Ribosomal RNA large subunit methyltransferase H [Spiroplasma poulsonii]PQM30733.1 Ribosomal RNA large subunit methyltransferase H [Spiroplasma poulsonii]PWF95719.1 Ribosomal RNA large subunit methyltransferase H [Spiroplasma poulsonii]PWF98499.1 Ribosomal RNA large subunit methyltransferase H [Spiroplasma poulsonii]
MFLERIKHYAKIEIIEIKEIVNKNEQVAVNEQTVLVIKKALDYPDYYKVLLALDGKSLTSEKIAALIADVKDFKKAKLMFIIGGSHGFNLTINPRTGCFSIKLWSNNITASIMSINFTRTNLSGI